MNLTDRDHPFCFGDVDAGAWADILEAMQTARDGSLELDARIDCILFGRVFLGLGPECRYYSTATDGSVEAGGREPAARWSQDVMASLRLIPADHNYSIGRRDGVCWAWIQPNDNWTPIGTEYRHDHPLGSGLVVANTMPLALMAAAMVLNHRGANQACTEDRHLGQDECTAALSIS
jgi:hypothetical protein